MINSFWNICSTCPMPKEEKLNSEYKRNYVWHPQYKPLAQDVISCAPQSIAKEIGMQRRKQYPDLAYRSHEVIRHDVAQHSKDTVDLRARSEERDAGLASKSGPRSRSAEPGMGHHQQKMIMIQSFPPIASGRVSMLPNTEEFPNIAEQPSETSEYQSQFAWPRKGTENAPPPCMARKSVSMTIIKSSDETDMLVPKTKLAPVHRPCVKHKEEKAEKSAKDARKLKTEYKSKYKPFTSYVYLDGQWKKTSRLVKVPEKENENSEPWFVEVVERLQKANEYRWRGHGQPVYGELLPDIYKKLPEVPTPRPKVVAPEHLVNTPKCHQPTSKRGETVKKETGLETIVEKRRDKERKTSPQLRRPKSAEPAKAKEPIKQKRPATTPPAKPTPRASSTRRRAPKDEDADKISKGRTPSMKKQRDTSFKALSSSSKKLPSSTSQSSGGKVWLQAEKTAPQLKPEDKPLVPETSDAVRPSSLSPIPAKALPEESNFEKPLAESAEGKENIEEVKSAVPQSVVPLTHVRTPEEVTGVKSPDPENWTVPIENSERLQWSGVNTVEKDTPKEKSLSEIDSPKQDSPKIDSPKQGSPKIDSPEPLPEPVKPSGEISETPTKLTTAEEPVPSPLVPQASSSEPKSSSSKLTSANVLDRARSRLDQFWGKNK